MKITLESVKLARQSMEEKLAEINAHRPNSKWKLGNCTYSETEATFKLHLQSVAEDGTIRDAGWQRLVDNLELVGLKEKHLDIISDYSFGRGRVVGLRRGGEKFIVQAVDTGKRYLAPVGHVRKKLGVKLS